MPVIFDETYYASKKQAARTGSALRYESPFAREDWNVDPVDMMSVEEFIKHLIAKYGPEYVEPVPYVRTTAGRLVPVTA